MLKKFITARYYARLDNIFNLAKELYCKNLFLFIKIYYIILVIFLAIMIENFRKDKLNLQNLAEIGVVNILQQT